MAAIPVPDLNLNTTTSSRSGELTANRSASFSFAGPTLNKTNYTTLAITAGVMIGAYLVAKKAGVL